MPLPLSLTHIAHLFVYSSLLKRQQNIDQRKKKFSLPRGGVRTSNDTSSKMGFNQNVEIAVTLLKIMVSVTC